MKRVTIALVAGVLALPLAAGPAEAHDHGPRAHDDHLRTRAGRTLTADVLGNDRGTAVVRHTAAAHGSVDIAADGTLRYTPEPGFTGRDSFTYTVSDAVKLYPTHLPPLATIGGVRITGGAYGSALTPVPGRKDEFYGLTDRGPNVGAPDGGKIEPLPQFDPRDREVPAPRRESRAGAGHPVARRGRHALQRPGQPARRHRREDRRPERERPAGVGERLRLRRSGRAEGRHLLGVRRVRPLHHPLRPRRPRDRAPLAVRRLAARRAEVPRAEQGHGRPRADAGRPDARRRHAVGAAAAGPDEEARQRHHAADRHRRPAHPRHPRVPLPARRPRHDEHRGQRDHRPVGDALPRRRTRRQAGAGRRTRSCSRST